MKKKNRQVAIHEPHPVLAYVLIGVTAMLAGAAIMMASQQWFGGGDEVGAKRALSESQADVVIKHEVQTAVSLLEGVYAKQQRGELTAAQAKKMGADLVRDMRYGDDNSGYFWIDTAEGVNVALYGRKDVEGKNRYNAQENGVYYIKEIIAQAKAGGGYTEYSFPKMDGGAAKAKRAYSELFGPYDWVVGTGYYLEDVIN